MASQQQQQQAAAAPPQLVGNAFVHQYYHILHHSPELVHRFYQDVSKLGRPDAADELSTITSMQAINEKILSLEYSEFKSEIKTVDAQESYNNGVLVLVTGFLTGKDNVKRNFTQSFFLAPQDKGYFVLNDIFRYVDEVGHQQQQPEDQVSNSGTELPPSHEDDFLQPSENGVPEQTASPPEEEEEEEEEEKEEVEEEEKEEEEKEANVEEVDNASENDEGSVVDEEAPTGEVVDEVQNNSQAVVDSTPAVVQEEAPKKSYASIVKVMKENPAPSFPAASPARAAPVNPPRQATTVATSSPTPEVPAFGSYGSESGDVQEAEADGYSIYIKNLPLNATVAQLEEEFKRFGPIKPDGIQVRSNKQQGFCFGFVEFEVASAVQSAIEASPIPIGGRPAYIEEKRPSGSRVGSRGRFAPGRGGGFRGDGMMRGRASYVGGRGGYVRGDFNNRSDFGTRGGGGRGGISARGDGGGGYQRVVDHSGNNNGSGRTNRAAGLPVNVSSKNVAPRVPAPA